MTQMSQYQSVHIGPALKRARERAGLTQDELARRLGLDESVPSRWECVGSTRYTAVPGFRLPQLADIFGVTVRELAPHAEPFDPVTNWADVDDDNVPLIAHLPESSNGVAESIGVTVPQPQIRYTMGDAVVGVPSPVPGRPSTGWRVSCWSCRRQCSVALWSDTDATCDGCGARLRAQVTVTLSSNGHSARY